MASDLEIKAKEAFLDDHFELAVDLYSQAIAMDPKKAELFADRAQANIKFNQFPEGVADATTAIELNPSLTKAYLRKGSAYIKLEEYESAKVALEAGASLAPEESRFTDLIKECDQRIAEENVKLSKQSMVQTPTTVLDPPSEMKDDTIGTSTDAELVVSKSKPKYRHAFYQTTEEVVVTIFAKGVQPNSVSVDYGEQILSVTIDIPDEDTYTFQPRLFGKIIPAKCKHEVLSTKIDIRLAKAESMYWKSLEFSNESNVLQMINVSSGIQRPKYPSSSSRTVDWDKLEAQVKKKRKKKNWMEMQL